MAYTNNAAPPVVAQPSVYALPVTHLISEPSESKFEAYPDDNPKTTQGMKKPSLSKIPSTALYHCALAMMDGAKKYGPYNWREKTVSSSIYVDAAERHLRAYFDGETNARDSKVHHLGHVMACCAIILDAEACGKLNDDRPLPSPFAEMIEEYAAKQLAMAAQRSIHPEMPTQGI